MAREIGPGRAAGRNPIPAELIGQARALRADLTSEQHRRRSAQHQEIASAIDAYLQEGQPSLALLFSQALRRTWEASSVFVALEGPVPGIRWKLESVVMHYFAGSDTKLDAWLADGEHLDDADWQPTIDLCRQVMTVERHLSKARVQASVRRTIHATSMNTKTAPSNRPFYFSDYSVATVTFHALARRVQRGGGTMAKALQDTASAGLWAAACLGLEKEARRVFLIVPSATLLPDEIDMPHLIAPTARGLWIGNVARSQAIDQGNNAAGVFARPTLRTFFDFDMVPDAVAADAAALVAMGPEAATGTPALTRCLAWANRERIGAMH